MKQPSVRISFPEWELTQLQSLVETAITLSSSMCSNPHRFDSDISQLAKLSAIKGMIDMMLVLGTSSYDSFEALYLALEDVKTWSESNQGVAQLEIRSATGLALDTFADIPIPFVIADKEPVSEGNTPSCPIPEECHQVGCMFACDDEVQS